LKARLPGSRSMFTPLGTRTKAAWHKAVLNRCAGSLRTWEAKKKRGKGETSRREGERFARFPNGGAHYRGKRYLWHLPIASSSYEGGGNDTERRKKKAKEGRKRKEIGYPSGVKGGKRRRDIETFTQRKAPSWGRIWGVGKQHTAS